jgi:glycosyltransferase involved in cell wall biosynthesis
LSEACGLLAMEAMCAGVPVLGSDCIGLREVLADTPSVMVPAADPKALAEALKAAIDTPCTQAARAFAPEARRRFDVRPRAGKLLALFDELQPSRNGRRYTPKPS